MKVETAQQDAAGTEDLRDHYALIGAGPMGLAMAKTLIEQGIPFTGVRTAFRCRRPVGHRRPASTMYETAHLISSKKMTEFTDFPMDREVAEYPSHRELKSYFPLFADRFDLRKSLPFETEVLSHGAARQVRRGLAGHMARQRTARRMRMFRRRADRQRHAVGAEHAGVQGRVFRAN
jgi:cation diffusion facilitator CzcD-associated flavoprotein CzcO